MEGEGERGKDVIDGSSDSSGSGSRILSKVSSKLPWRFGCKVSTEGEICSKNLDSLVNRRLNGGDLMLTHVGVLGGGQEMLRVVLRNRGTGSSSSSTRRKGDLVVDSFGPGSLIDRYCFVLRLVVIAGDLTSLVFILGEDSSGGAKVIGLQH